MTGYQDHCGVVVELVREELARGGLARLRVSGDSMAPLIGPGDVVLVRRADPADLRRGDVLLIEREGSFVIHRLVAADGRRLRTKGDNVSHADPAVAPQDVLGQVVGVEKNGRRVELDRGRWPVLNRLLGLLGWGEVQLFAAGGVARRRLVGVQGSHWTSRLAVLLAIPFRWLTRLVA